MRYHVGRAVTVCLIAGMAIGSSAALGQSIDDLKNKAKQAAEGAKEVAEKAKQDAKGLFGSKPEAKATDTKLDLSQPLPIDERLVTGTLPNGMNYIVLKHSNPPGRANMYIHVSSGSLNETDKQRGIAHFLEHMAFNGSENFPPGKVVDFFQSMGLTFGQHQNAFTSFDQTTYILSFPDTKAETIERGMRFFGDVASRLSLTQKEIDEERGIILEEKRTRLGAGQRVQEYVLERLIPGSLIGSRLPIGVDETLKSVQQPDFQDYYSKWYVPSNMTVMVVADAEPQAIVSQIEKSFSGGEKKPKPVDNDPMVKAYDSTRGIVAHDKELTQAEVGVTIVGPKQNPVTTLGDMRRDLVEEIATSALNRRVGAKLAKGGMSFTSGSASTQNLFNAAHIRGMDVTGEPGKWRDMLKEMGTELQRARLHGFTDREIDDVKSNLTAGAERFVEQEKSIPANGLIRRLNNSIASGDTPMSATQELGFLKQLLPTITRDEVSKKFAELFDAKYVTFVAQLPDSVPGGLPTESELVELGRKALDVSPEADKEEARATSLLASKPTPGKVVESDTHDKSGVSSAWLDNNVRVHHRFMDIRKDSVWININLAGGQIQETAQNRGITDVASLAWQSPATSTLSSTDIRDLMTGKTVNVGGGIGMDTMTVSVSGKPEELEVGMQKAYLMLTDPKIEASAFDRWKTSTQQAIEGRSKNPQAAMAEAMMKTVYPPTEARTQMLTMDQLNKLSIAPAQAWLTSAIKTAPIEVTVVGDITKERAMELVTTYIGSLPKRDRISGSTLDDIRTITKVKGPIVNKVELDTETPVAVVVNGFYGPDAENVADSRKMQFASRILSTRCFKKIREAEQLAYSPRAGFQPGDAYPGFGTMAMFMPTDPPKVDRLVAASGELYADFSKDGPTADEMDVAKKQVANTLDETMKQPDFWVARTATMTYRNVKLDDVVTAAEFYEKLTADDIKNTFNTYYKPEAMMQCVVKPLHTSEGKLIEIKPEMKPDTKPSAEAPTKGG